MANSRSLVLKILIPDYVKRTFEDSTFASSSASSRDSKLSVEFIKKVADGYVSKDIRQTTLNKYVEEWRTFNRFLLNGIDKIPNTWEDRLVVYVTFLVDTGKQSATIKSYISAIKKMMSFEDINYNHIQAKLKALIKSAKLQNDKVKMRFPINRKMLHAILDKIDEVYLGRGQPYLASLYRAMCALGYHALLRVGEMAKGDHPVLVKDVSSNVAKQKIQVILRTSKTYGLGTYPKVVTVPFKSNAMRPYNIEKENRYSPFLIIRNYGKFIRPKALSLNEPYFVFQDRSPVKPEQFRKMLKKMIDLLNVNSQYYNTHSLRIGGANDLEKWGATVDQIKKWGRWLTGAVWKYFR